MNTMRVKPYAMSSPSRNARHTATGAESDGGVRILGGRALS